MRDVVGRLNVIDDGIRNLQNSNQSSSESTERIAWARIAGNSIVYNYYAGVSAGNPSGNTNNVETAEYSDKLGVVFTQTFTYDANDNIISIVVS